MRRLDELRLQESPDLPILEKPWLDDIRELRCIWDSKRQSFSIDIELSSHERDVELRFTGAFDVVLDGGLLGCAIRILDASAFLPEIPAPIRVQLRRGEGFSF